MSRGKALGYQGSDKGFCAQAKKHSDLSTLTTTEAIYIWRAERLVSNLITGVQFLRKESNSHYHAHRVSLMKTDATFSGAKLVPPDVKENFNAYQRMYLATCLEVPAKVLGGVT